MDDALAREQAAPGADHATPGSDARTISLAETIRIALDAVLANKLRSALTALGVIIGVAAVVALLALGNGAQARIAAQITANGANLVTVRAGSLRAGGFSSSGGAAQSLTGADAAALADPANVPAAKLVSPEHNGFGTLAAGAQSTSGMVAGVTPAYATLHNHALAQGEFIDDGHVRGMRNVTVLGARVAATLFPDGDALGQSIRINGQRFRVIGVLATKGGGMLGSVDDSALVPLTTAQRRLFGARDARGKPTVSGITVQAIDAAHVPLLQAQISATLRERHRLPGDGSADDFSIDNQQDLIATLTASQRTMTLYLGAIAAISLVVGGIGIMNIMLVSVRERTREIGLRKAIGARERDILRQFVLEALALSTGGGVLGLLLGVGIALFVDRTGRAPAIVSASSVTLAVGVAVAIGLFFGIEPARRAARLDPIAALRYE